MIEVSKLVMWIALMMTSNTERKREQMQFVSMYDLVEDKYSPDMGRPSMDPVTFIKIPFIQKI